MYPRADNIAGKRDEWAPSQTMTRDVPRIAASYTSATPQDLSAVDKSLPSTKKVKNYVSLLLVSIGMPNDWMKYFGYSHYRFNDDEQNPMLHVWQRSARSLAHYVTYVGSTESFPDCKLSPASLFPRQLTFSFL
jgi:hypothetical protein